MDAAILIWIQENLRTDFFTPILLLITNIGHYGACWLALGLWLALRQSTRQQGILTLIAILFCGGVGECIKHLIMRPRPFLQIPELMPLGHLPHSFSFPSGHTICAFATAFILWRTCSGWQRCLLMVSALLMAFSRLYVGAHYPTDVFGGIVVAFLGSQMVWHVLHKYVLLD